jgi:hypothetical protein
MEKLEFETLRHRIGKAFGRPPIAPAPVVIEVKATPWGEPRVHLNRPPRSRGGVGAAALCATACVALIVGAHGHLRPAEVRPVEVHSVEVRPAEVRTDGRVFCPPSVPVIDDLPEAVEMLRVGHWRRPASTSARARLR